jgi:pre-rRNA-processing protein IPI3
VATGDLLSVVPAAHYRAVTALRFSDDGGRLVSGSDDGTAKVWETRSLVDRSGGSGGAITPVHTWAEHTLPVTGVHCGYGGLQARVLTVSKDCSCKVWELATGELAGTLSLPSDLWSVTADAAEQYVYCGAGDGVVYAVALFRVELTPRAATSIRANDVLRFVGHTEPVTSVAVTVDATTLVSGSEDGTARVWDAESRQCLRVLGHKEPITAMFIVPKHWIDRASESTTAPVSPFSRQQAPADGSAARDFKRGTPLRLTSGTRRHERSDDSAWPARIAAAAAAGGGGPGGEAEDEARVERDRLAVEVQQWRTAAGALYAHATRAAGL